ncbi:MAG: FAD-dependent oxidoreductase [Candidatus Hydrogenedentota bacterium]
MNFTPDILIIGGGITGCAAARDAAGRGHSVVLLEKNDLGSGTTSRSSRMAHGGLRYLERLQLGLVRESLTEREMLFRTAPDLVARARFRLPVSGGARARWYIGAGLALYDLLSFSKNMRIESDGFSYVDGICRPERLAASLAADAVRRGAEIATYCGVKSIDREGLVVSERGEEFKPRALILCAGPWTDRLLSLWSLPFPCPLLAPTRGTHLLMTSPIAEPRLLQASSDGRVFFALPAFGGTLVGTTDLDDTSDPSQVRPRDEEIEYLLRELKKHLPEAGDSVRGAWTGLRPLLASAGRASDRSRGELVASHPAMPSLTVVVGGKLTTMRLMAERAVNHIEREHFHETPRPWTSEARIPLCDETAFCTKLSDVLLRREYTGFSGDASAIAAKAEATATRMGWNRERIDREMKEFRREAEESFGLASP